MSLPAQVVTLPCHRCGKPATALEVPQLPADALEKMHSALNAARSFAWLTGVEVPDVAPGQHPFAAIPPEQIAAFMGIAHAACIAANVQDAQLLEVQADGAAN